MVKMIIEVGETDRTKVRPKLLKASLMNGKRQNMREICIDDNSNDERQEALARFEQLRKTKMVVDDNVESIISRRTDSY
ncbi:hypothetical protein DW159_02115 [Coprococcus sp. AM14-16]|nr:hypothetical protein DW159_02115 [Coprococcus sp. AM14-16]